MLDFEGKPLSDDKVERQKERFFRDPLLIWDREYPFAEDLIVDDSATRDATLPVPAKMSSPMGILRLGGP